MPKYLLLGLIAKLKAKQCKLGFSESEETIWQTSGAFRKTELENW